MTARHVCGLAVICSMAAGPSPLAAQDIRPRELAVAFVERVGDPAYRAATGYAGLFRRDHFSPFPAAELAISDGTAAARAAGLKLALVRRTLDETEDAATALRATA